MEVGEKQFQVHRHTGGYHVCTFRKDPVPYTSSRGSYGSWLKSPKTAQELRLNAYHKQFARGKRRNLPTLYDDLCITKERNWKSFGRKKKQWDKKS